MIFNLIATALIAASGASALDRPSFDDISGGIDDTDDNTHGQHYVPGPNDGSPPTVVGASIECSSEAWASSYSVHKDAYAHAVKNAVKNTCYYGYDSSYWQKSYSFMKDWAVAYANAFASAEAECKASSSAGTAKGCAYAKADAYAFSTAIAEAHASATAEAFADYCSCSNAEAWAFGDADIVLKLIAVAFAEAEAVACAKNDQHSKASAYANCYANVIAKVWAYAMAEAAAEAQCWPGNDAHASADIVAKVKAFISIQEFCVINISEDGNAGGSVGHSGTYTGHFDITDFHR